MKKWIFFDLDATLIDVKKAQNAAIKGLYDQYNFSSCIDFPSFARKWDELTEYHYAFYARREISYEEQRIRRIVDLFATYGKEMDSDPSEIYDDYLKYFEQEWCLFDDVIDAISTLRNSGHKLGIISNGDFNQQSEKLRKTGIDGFFEVITTSSEYGFSKPDKRLFEAVVSRFAIDKKDIVMVGDQVEKDVLPCLEIGIDAIWLNRNGKANRYDVAEIKSLNELLNLGL